MFKYIQIIILCFGLLTGCTSSVRAQKQVTLMGPQGKLAAVLQTPKNKKNYPLVMVMHGFNANKEMYLLTELARQLNERGIATILFDFNGHGQSEGSFLDMTVLNELEDARRVYAYVSRLPHVTSVSAVGHSQGGVVVGMLAGELGAEKIKSIVLMAPASELKEDTAKGDLFGIKFDPQNIPEYIVHESGLKIGRAFLETTPHLPIYEQSAKYTGPVLIVHSKDDELVPFKYGQEFVNIYTNHNARLLPLTGFNHNFTQDTPAVDKLVADFFAQQLLNN